MEFSALAARMLTGPAEGAVFPVAETELDGVPAAGATEFVVAAAGAVADALADSEYLVGGRFGVADILAATALSIPKRAGFPEDISQDLKTYVARLKERPAYQRAKEREAGATTAR